YGPVEFFEDADRLLDIVTRLTALHEGPRAEPWAVTDAPADFIQAQLRGIVGLRMPIARIEGKRKMSQNRSLEDRAGVAAGLQSSERTSDQAVAALIRRLG
ncbi:FMN-binding negative transcriptional regulator, partial [Actinomadura sp. DSM 109109]|nr:FMN-binding negative transcriptional regulator [Actinomadura lepetitiana]